MESDSDGFRSGSDLVAVFKRRAQRPSKQTIALSESPQIVVTDESSDETNTAPARAPPKVLSAVRVSPPRDTTGVVFYPDPDRVASKILRQTSRKGASVFELRLLDGRTTKVGLDF